MTKWPTSLQSPAARGAAIGEGSAQPRDPQTATIGATSQRMVVPDAANTLPAVDVRSEAAEPAGVRRPRPIAARSVVVAAAIIFILVDEEVIGDSPARGPDRGFVGVVCGHAAADNNPHATA